MIYKIGQFSTDSDNGLVLIKHQAITQTNDDQILRSQKASLRPQWVYIVPNLVENDNIIEPSYTKFLTMEPRQ